MKKVIILIIIWITTLDPLFSQSNYFKILSSPEKDGSGDCIQTDEGDIILRTSVSDDTPFSKKFIKFIKINYDGDTISSLFFRLNTDYYDFTKILSLEDDRFVAVGSSFDFAGNFFYSKHNKIIYFTFNSNLDSLSFREIVMDTGQIQLLSIRDAILTTHNHIVTLGEDMSKYRIMLMEAAIDGDSVRSSEIIPVYGVNVYSIMEKPASNNYLISVEGDFNHLNQGYVSHIITLDSLFNYKSIDSLPGECAYFSQIANFNNHLLIGGRAWRHWVPDPIPPYPLPYSTEEYCIEKLDSNFVVQQQQFLSHVVIDHNQDINDTISYPALGRNFDFIDTNSIYSCHYREYPTLIYPALYNYYVITKHNHDLSVKWQYYIGHDAYYFPNYILATADGGCFVSGSRYDYQTQYQECDIFYMKLDSTGVFASNKNGETHVRSAIVFPNPGSNYLSVCSGPQIFGATFELFDLNGKLLNQQFITDETTTISTSELETGTYVWRILYKNKEVESGKWVKSL